MSITKAGRRRGHTVVAVALAGLMSSVPVKADTPHGLPEIEAATATPVDPTATPVAEPELAPIVEEAGPEYQHLADGEASYYGVELAGNRKASGEIFDHRKLTAAHPTLPMGKMLRVTKKSNGTSVIVRINDQRPFVKQRNDDDPHPTDHQNTTEN